MNYILIALLWAAYCLLHSYLISTSVTNWLMKVLKQYYAFYRLFYVVISLVLLFPVFHYTNQLATGKTIVYEYPFSILRISLTIFSLLLFFKAFIFDYDAFSFFGIRQILNFKKKPDIKPGEIKRNGLLGIVRHPMYFALIIYLWSQTFSISDIVANAVLTIYVIIGTILEEKKLVLEFGEKYSQYKKEVPMLIPFLKFK